jgi:hypothetical protein
MWTVQYMDVENLADAQEDLLQLIEDYKGLDLPQPCIPGGLAPRRIQLSPLFYDLFDVFGGRRGGRCTGNCSLRTVRQRGFGRRAYIGNEGR